MSHPPAYKPSPLSFGSPRTSPFRRPESPASPSPSASTLRPITPTKPHTPLTSPQKPHTPLTSPFKLHQATIPSTPPPTTPNFTPSHHNTSASPTTTSTSPVRTSQTLPSTRTPLANTDLVAKLPTAQVREMREGFQVLDRDNDGQVTRDDVIDMLTNLGLDASPSALAPFFSASAPSSTLSLPVFLQTLSARLAPLSPPADLLSAFAAFDDDDDGQIHVKELKDALLHTSPEPGERALSEREIDGVLAGFSGRRAFGSKAGGKERGEVFRYRDFVAGLTGGGEAKGEEVIL